MLQVATISPTVIFGKGLVLIKMRRASAIFCFVSDESPRFSGLRLEIWASFGLLVIVIIVLFILLG